MADAPGRTVGLARLRPAEWLAGAAAVALLAVMFLDWFEPTAVVLEGGGVRVDVHGGIGWTAWQAFSVVDVLLALAAVAALALVVATATQPNDALSLCVAVVETALALLATVLVAIRVLIAQPGLGIGAPDWAVETTVWGYAGVLASVALFVAGWWSMRDERSAVGPPPEVPARRLAPADR